MKAISFIVEAPTLYRHSRSTNIVTVKNIIPVSPGTVKNRGDLSRRKENIGGSPPVNALM